MQKLYEAIADKYDKYAEAKKIFGEDHHLTVMYFREMVGLKEAFEIVFGISYVDYFIGNTAEET
jgi:hypothetical protein